MDFRKGREDIPLDDEDIVDENETAAEKRVRLAKGYLAKVKDDLETGKLFALQCSDQMTDAKHEMRKIMTLRISTGN